ncbi:MAG: hypothetical protein COA73_18710 [Candidatus Hydrogenedentota bacterium]|nr:MAG: hypothetical protein COA73_18710 [Candidatus Hydrogenedentota bacterium]
MKLYEACEDVQEDFSALLDEELAPDEVEGVEAHLSTCSDCLRELDSLKKMQSVYDALPKVDAPDRFKVDLREKSKSAPVSLRINPRHTKVKPYKFLIATAAMLLFIGSLWGLVGNTSDDTAPVMSSASPQADAVFNVALMDSGVVESTDDESNIAAMKSSSAVMESLAVPMATESDSVKKEMILAEEEISRFGDSVMSPSEPVREFTSARVDNRDVWTQQGFTDQEVLELKPNTPELAGIIASNPYLAKIINIVHEVTFEHEGAWYRVTN